MRYVKNSKRRIYYNVSNSRRIKIEKISIHGPGVIILTGPSSCGKGAVGEKLRKLFSMERKMYLSMGDILRTAFHKAKIDKSYSDLLEKSYSISKNQSIFDSIDSTEHLKEKVSKHLDKLNAHFNYKEDNQNISQIEWLEFCTVHGLLVPNRWTQVFMETHILNLESRIAKPFIIDGYPRTVQAAEHLLTFLDHIRIPIIKVIHLSISKQEMIERAKRRGRLDDDGEALNNRYNFYVNSVQPSVDFIKDRIGSSQVSIIDAHQPVYSKDQDKSLNLDESINNVVADVLYNLGVSKNHAFDLLKALDK